MEDYDHYAFLAAMEAATVCSAALTELSESYVPELEMAA